MSIIDTIKAKAKADVKHIVLPEGSEERTVQAARLITDQGIAKVTLIGKSEDQAEHHRHRAQRENGIKNRSTVHFRPSFSRQGPRSP